jgi:predicted transcriptional regulator
MSATPLSYVATRIAPELLTALDVACALTRRSRSDAIRVAIEDFVDGVLAGHDERPAEDGAPDASTVAAGEVAGAS